MWDPAMARTASGPHPGLPGKDWLVLFCSCFVIVDFNYIYIARFSSYSPVSTECGLPEESHVQQRRVP